MASKAALANSTAEIFQTIEPGVSYEKSGIATSADTLVGPFTPGVSVIRIVTTDQPIFVTFGEDNTVSAANSSKRCYLMAGYTEYLTVGGKYMAIRNAGSGSTVAYICEGATEGQY